MWSTIALLFCAIAPPGATILGVPDPANSFATWHDASGPCQIPLLCPVEGPYSVDVTVRNQFNVPESGISPGHVWLESDAALGSGSPCAQVTRILSTTYTDGSGRVTISVSAGGGTSRILRAVTDYKITVVLDSLAFRSADGTGDLVVDLADLGLLAQSFNRGTASPMDLTCDGAIDLADLGLFADHYTHGCR